MFFECCNETTGEVFRPQPWGFNLGEELKQNLIDLGWHTTTCADMNAPCTNRQKRVPEDSVQYLESLIDRIFLNLL